MDYDYQDFDDEIEEELRKYAEYEDVLHEHEKDDLGEEYEDDRPKRKPN